jgi:nicotinate-nucleotide pyrophosphorylase (carboxylating)
MKLDIDASIVQGLLDAAIAEDVGRGDLTSEALIPDNALFQGVMRARQNMVVAGLGICLEVFLNLAPGSVLKEHVSDGDRLTEGAILTEIRGPAKGLLTAERTALNLVQHLSGIATLTRSYVDRIEGTGAVLLDTRKTVPQLRAFAKYATRMGGCRNHRMRLDDGVLIKDNHIAVCGGIKEAVTRAREAGLSFVEVECENAEHVKEALDAGADRLLLDNMKVPTLRKCVELVSGRAQTEASGGINLETIRAVAETGVDFISVGAITHSAPAVDIGLDWIPT